ncbi:MAG TPA: CocE/NonD family hydrolase, partial [Jatrophihabitantaceae bacterium]
NGVIAKMPLFYDNYFVPRGYAMAQLDLPGTGRSTGCADAGGPDQIAGVTAAINWLNGRGKAFDGSGQRVTATAWSNGKVGMIGKSWDGSVANGAAATGVAGLKTVVAISSISSWYDYMRADGVLRGRNYVKFLDKTVSGRPAKVCKNQFATEQGASDDATADFNSYWQASDYRRHAGRVKASMFIVHGLHDENVIPNQFSSWWQALGTHGVTRKLWLSQTGHVDPFDYRRSHWVRTLHEWFDHWLQGLHNGVMTQPQVSVQRPSGGWTTERSWPNASSLTTVRFGTAGSAKRTIVDHPKLHEHRIITRPRHRRAGRTVFLGAEHAVDQHLSGTPSVRLRIKLNRRTSEISARLVQYGRTRRVDYDSPGLGITTTKKQSCWGQSTAVDDACYLDTRLDYTTSDTDVLSRGWIDAAHRNSLNRPSDLTPGKWYTVVVPMSPTDTVVPAGHRLGVVLTLSDKDFTDPSHTGATAVVDPAHSWVRLPVRTKGRT